jgi:hypothetical protein
MDTGCYKYIEIFNFMMHSAAVNDKFLIVLNWTYTSAPHLWGWGTE